MDPDASDARRDDRSDSDTQERLVTTEKTIEPIDAQQTNSTNHTTESIDEELTVSEEKKQLPRDAVETVQQALLLLREKDMPPYLADAASLVNYVRLMQDHIAGFTDLTKRDPLADYPPMMEIKSQPLDLKVRRQIEITGDNPYEPATYLEDEGDDSFARKYLQGAGAELPLTRTRSFTKGGLHLRTTLLIQSPVLIQGLKRILAPSPSESYGRLYSQKIEFYRPYIALFQNRKRLQAAVAKGEEPSEKALLKLLLDFLKQDVPTTWQKLDELEAGTCTQISFEDAWILFPPGTAVFVSTPTAWEAYKTKYVTANSLPTLDTICINSQFLDFDDTGTKLLPSNKKLEIWPYSGERQISDLEVVPETHLADRQSICDSLRVRGESFWDFNGSPAYRQYIGSAWPTTLPSDCVRVMVDLVSPSRYQPDGMDTSIFYPPPPPPPPIGGEAYAPPPDNDLHDNCAICAWKYARLACYPPTVLASSAICTKDRWPKTPLQETDEEGQDDEPKSTLMYCPSHVWAFSLKHKTWKTVEVHKLGPMVCSSDPLKKLVMSDQYKLVVESMVDAHLSKSIFSDVVKDKGRGLIVLLHGGPGTGKTLTAECVAEKKKRPLYVVTCGDLGTNPDELEKRLQNTFLFAVNWNAILLLDEADVFLQERDLQDLHRNALVSIFLRHIEYYDGLLFLTTNRPGQIDEAFQSRIHITLGLPELDFERQKQVWLIFIKSLQFKGDKNTVRRKKVELLSFVDKELEQELVKVGYHMNGRQIRNCIHAATAIAKKNGRELQKEDVITVIGLGAQFKDYMQKVNRMTQDEKARALGLRLLQDD